MQTGKIIMLIGVGVILIGGLIYLGSRFGIPLGRLPGDIRIERENFSFSFPLTTSILFSIFLTIIINVALRIFNK